MSISESNYSHVSSPSQAPDGSLVDYSPTDKPWDVHRAQADGVGGSLRSGLQRRSEEQQAMLLKHAKRIDECCQSLLFHYVSLDSEEKKRLNFEFAFFCRVRYCPICQWRRSLMWRARFYNALPGIQSAYPKHRFLFLTLTVRNCPIGQLRATLSEMNKSWKRLVKRSEFEIVSGWLRTVEVTHSQSSVGDAHPHYHILLLVPPSYFKGSAYISHARWVELWQSCARLDYSPSVEIKAVKSKKDKGVSGLSVEDMQGAVMEVLKYSTKPDDLVSSSDWLTEYAIQTHKLRFIASGGLLKDVLKEEEETNQDLVTPEGQEQEGEIGERLIFDWAKPVKKYKRRINLKKRNS